MKTVNKLPVESPGKSSYTYENENSRYINKNTHERIQEETSS
jgi:hypothetical protein